MSVEVYEKLLAQMRENQLEELELWGSKLKEDYIGELVEELKGNKSVKEVKIWNCNPGPRLFDMLKMNRSVTKLELSNNNFGADGARAISEVLKVNQCVKELCVLWNDISSDGARAIGEMLGVNNTLKILVLSNNDIGPEGVGYITKALIVNQSVERLLLNDEFYDLGIEGAQAIGEMLKFNYNLKVLGLERNDFGSTGSRLLVDSMQVNGSLLICFVDEFQYEVNALCNRNRIMHKRARVSVIYLLALQKARQIMLIPKEMMVMIGQMLLKTKCDVDAWNK